MTQPGFHASVTALVLGVPHEGQDSHASVTEKEKVVVCQTEMGEEKIPTQALHGGQDSHADVMLWVLETLHGGQG